MILTQVRYYVFLFVFDWIWVVFFVFVFVFVGAAGLCHAACGILIANQGWNSSPLHWNRCLNHWTIGKFQDRYY